MTGLNPGSRNLTNGIRIGGNYLANNDWFKGDMAEFILLDETSDSTTISKMEGYLAHKWGLAGSLPAGHTYKSTASVATTSSRQRVPVPSPIT